MLSFSPRKWITVIWLCHSNVEQRQSIRRVHHPKRWYSKQMHTSRFTVSVHSLAVNSSMQRFIFLGNWFRSKTHALLSTCAIALMPEPEPESSLFIILSVTCSPACLPWHDGTRVGLPVCAHCTHNAAECNARMWVTLVGRRWKE